MPTPPLPLCDYDQVRTQIAAGLHIAADQLATEWMTLCSAAAKDATVELRRIFIMKGYAVSQLEQWDDGTYYCNRLCAYFTFVRGTSLASYDLKSVEWLDPRKELTESAALIIGGEAVAPPTTGDLAAIQYGRNVAADTLMNPDTPGGYTGMGTTWDW